MFSCFMSKEKSVIKKPKEDSFWNILKKGWDYVWNGDSFLSWIIMLVVAFVVMKYLFYPGLGLVLGTDLPIVAVISDSMEHPQGDNWFYEDGAMCYEGPCVQREWYLEHNISEEDFDNFLFSNGFNKGDLMVLFGSSPKNTQIGDVIVYYRPDGIPVIHRVFDKFELSGRTYYSTKGDNNIGPLTPQQAGFDENQISASSVAGKAVARVPWLGWIKLAFTNVLSSLFGLNVQ